MRGNLPEGMAGLMRLASALLFLLAAAVGGNRQTGLECANEEGQLFPVDIELLSNTHATLYSSREGSSNTVTEPQPRKLCNSYPFSAEHLGDKFSSAWAGFTDLSTVQFVLPPSMATTALTGIRISSSASGAGAFVVHYQDNFTFADGGAATVSYPPKGASVGDPVHLSLFATGTWAQGTDTQANMLHSTKGERLMAVWVSFAEQYSCADYDHCCVITKDGFTGTAGAPGCDVGAYGWQCRTDEDTVWRADGAEVVHSINFLGPLANTTMNDGGSLLLHLADDAELGVPLTNSYVEHAVTDSPACRNLCRQLTDEPALDLHGNAHAAACTLASDPSIKALSGFGPITLNGFGRVNGQKMMQDFLFHGKAVWQDPGAGVLNGYGSAVPTFKSLGDAEAHTRWRIMSGLVELSTATTGANGFAIDMSEMSVAWGGKRGDGSIRLQFPRVPLDGQHTPEDSNQPVKMFDVKTPGTWVGASDGPRVTADRSWLGFLYLHHADDNLKIDSSYGMYTHITLLQGNIGSAVELGTYGIGIRQNTVQHATATGIYIHRITHGDSMDDALGSVLGTRTCPWGITLKNITVQDVSIPSIGSQNKVNAVFNVGTYGAPATQYSNESNLDRWFFCSNAWWLDNNTIATSGRAATLEGLHFNRWSVGVQPVAASALYNFHSAAPTAFRNLTFTVNNATHSVANAPAVSGEEDLWPA